MSDVRLSCAIVQDLLPSYIDGLTSPETNQSIEEHLAHCRPCSTALAQMRGEPVPTATPGANGPVEPGLQYMRKVKRRRVFSIVAAAVAAAMLMALVMGFYLNYHALKQLTPEQVTQLDVYQLEDGAIYLRISIEKGYDITSNFYDGVSLGEDAEQIQVSYYYMRPYPHNTSPKAATHLLVDPSAVSEVVLRARESGEELVLWRRGDVVPDSPLTLDELNKEVGFGAPWIGPKKSRSVPIRPV